MDANVDIAEKVCVNIRFSSDWDVIVYNDDTTYVQAVIDCFEEVFDMSSEEAYIEAMAISNSETGYEVVATYPEKLAKIRAKKAVDFVRERGFKDFTVVAKERED